MGFGARSIIVLEEKRKLLEDQIKSILYNIDGARGLSEAKTKTEMSS